ncbi:hypothetical protein D9613_009753 [Agrocybe pediades]|uniref:Nephrocystin 3-like N-terminal domain-containing protein n=1 Tax=Agrocybe pediades TaxID=84607 RepID=A0A8H4QY05_9AGAR|nr:hypothetical protein D9613_009753 [Agrocybe pediades]
MSQPDSALNPQFVHFEKSIVSNGTFTQHNQHIDNRHYTFRSGENAGYATLLDNVAAAAIHDSIDVVDPPKCHPNTRVAIIQTIIDWAKGVADEKINLKSMIWLNGGAGAGKSAIARSVAERCVEQGLLLGSFFFAARDTSRNHIRGLVATLCYQMCIILPEFRDKVSALIEKDPLIFNRSIGTQLTTLLIDPLSSIISANHSGPTNIPRLIIIDGLDECSETMDQKTLLLALQEATRSMPHIRFLVCSRPEKHINASFGLSQMAHIFYQIFLGDDYDADHDIWVYLEDKFKEIKKEHLYKHMLPAAWPTYEMIRDLVKNSSGMFIYASTVIRYIESPGHKPHQRLEAVFNVRPAFKDLPFTQLDALYRHIIYNVEDTSKVLDILAFPLSYRNSAFPITLIEVLLQLERGDVEVMLGGLQSVVAVAVAYFHRVRDSSYIKFLHKSFADFLSDQQRAGDLYRDPSAVRLQHIARTITAFSIPYLPEIDVLGRSGYLTVNSPEVADWLQNYGVLQEIFQIPQDTEPISSEILKAARQFPMVEFIRELLHTGDLELPWTVIISHQQFLSLYFQYFSEIISPAPFAQDKLSPDILQVTMLVHTEQMCQYCEGVLSALENDWSDNGQAYFIYVFYHLFPVLRHQRGLLRMCTSLVDLYDPFFRGARAFGSTIGSIANPRMWEDIQIAWRENLQWNNGVGPKTSYELTKGIKQEAIFAKLSANFCLAPLCDERNTRQDARRISMIMGTDQRKRRERPWRWRQLSRRRSLHNGVGSGMGIHIRSTYGQETVILMRFNRKARSYRKLNCFDPIFTIPEYLSSKGCNLWISLWSFKINNAAVTQGGPTRYMHLLELLPHILPSVSGRYEPLVTMCRKKCFASISQFWPKKSRRARQAIEAYLRRVDPQEDISEGKNPGHLGDPSQSMALQESNASERKHSGLSGDPSPSLQSRKDGERPEVQEGVQLVDSQENTSGEFLGLLGDPSISSERREDDSEKPEGQVDIQPFYFNIRPYMHLSIVFLSILLLFSVFIVIS